MEDHNAPTLTRNPSRNHLQSSFPSMIVGYTSSDELSKHLGRQMSLQSEKIKELQSDIDESIETEGSKMKIGKLKRQQMQHGEILQGPKKVHHQRVKTQLSAEGEDALDEEERENLKKLKEKEHDDLIHGLLLLRDYYKAEYKKALQEKVEQQRKAMQSQRQKLEEQSKISQRREEENRHKVPHKLPRSVLINDRQVYKDRLQTDYYKIIGLENKLKKEGYLNKMHEVNEFWNFITIPENLANVIEDGELTWERIRNYHRQHEASVLSGQIDPKASAEPKLEKKERKGPLKGTSAVSTWRSTTHGIRTLMTPSSPFDIASGRRKSSGIRTKKTPPTSAIPIEQRFPKVEFPPLAAYRLEFGEPEPDPDEVRKQEEANKRAEARNGHKRTISTMFSHALANRAATQRLMDKNEEYNFESLSGTVNFDEFHEFVSVQLKRTGSSTKSEQSRKSSGKTIGSNARVEGHRNSSKTSKRPASYISDRSDTDMSLSSKEDLEVALAPLTLDQLSNDCVVKEAKCLSTFWVNPAAKQDFKTMKTGTEGWCHDRRQQPVARHSDN